MSKYNLEDLLNEYIGGGRIGTLKISFKDLQDKMDELENSGKVIVRTLPGPSGDGKVNREFEVVDRESAVAGGNKQERGFTVYDYKFGFDPGDEEHFMEEYPFSVGGNDLKLAMELIDGVEAGISEEKDDKKELPQSIKDKEARDAEIEAKKAKGMMKEANEDYDLLKIKKEIRFHLDTYEKGIIDGDDLAQAVEEVVFGEIKAPGMREGHAMSDNEADLEAGVKGNMDAFTEEVDVDLVKQTVARANNQIVTPGDMAKFILDVINQVAEKEQDGILNNNNIKQAMVFLDKAKNATGKKPVEENGHVDDYAEEIKEVDNIEVVTLLNKVRKHLVDKFDRKYSKPEFDLYIDSLERDIKRGEFDGVESLSMEDHEIDFEDYIRDKMTMEENKALKEHFSRFMFKKYS